MAFSRPTIFGIAFCLVLGFAGPGLASSIKPFLGHWAGAGITEEQGPGSDYGFADRDLDVTIVPTGNGFRITWQTLQQDPSAKSKKAEIHSKTVTFVETAREGFFRMDQPWKPVTGDSFQWAQLPDGKLIVHSIAILENGTLEYQKYTRVLVSDTQMQLFYIRSVDGNVVKSVLAQLTKK